MGILKEARESEKKREGECNVRYDRSNATTIYNLLRLRKRLRQILEGNGSESRMGKTEDPV